MSVDCGSCGFYTHFKFLTGRIGGLSGLKAGRREDTIQPLPLPLNPQTTTHSYPRMRSIYNDELLEVPQGVTADIKSRVITVEGPRGKLTKVCFVGLSLFPLLNSPRSSVTSTWTSASRRLAKSLTAPPS